MEKFRNGDIVKYINGETYIIVSWARGDHHNTFQGTVIFNEEKGYPVGDHSRTWHEDLFEIFTKGVTVTLNT